LVGALIFLKGPRQGSDSQGTDNETTNNIYLNVICGLIISTL